MKAKLDAADFVRLFREGGATKIRKLTGQKDRAIYARRADLERQFGCQIKGPGLRPDLVTRRADEHAAVLKYPVKDGIVLIGSDAHIWPGKPTTAMRAFTKFAKDYEPKIVILNGDVLDFPQV